MQITTKSSVCTGFFLNHEDFSGDIYQYNPLYSLPCANVITFGPPGAGKSSFVNSVCSALGDHIQALNVAGATRNVVTSGLLRFPLYEIPEFEDLKFALYDVPGVDGKNYKGDEMPMMMHGVLTYDVDFKHDPAKFSDVQNKRSPHEEEFGRRAHVVAFFVPQGAAGDTALMASLATFFYEITVVHKRKAIVIISHADEISGEDERADVLSDICQKLSIDSSSVFFLENYVDTKVKQFHVDKSVLRILLAMISRADDFLTYDRLNPTVSPYPKSTAIVSHIPKPTTTYSPGKGKAPVEASEDELEAILAKLPEALRLKLDPILKEEEIDDAETFKAITPDGWKGLGLKMGDVVKIGNATKE